MSMSCPVCEEPVTDQAGHCPNCGFPSALREDAVRALSRPEPVLKAERVRRPAPAPASAKQQPDVQADVARRVAKELEGHLSIYERLGGEPDEIISEVSQAALTQADGRTGEALAMLRAADARVLGMSVELFERRVKDIERREGALQKDRVQFEATSSCASMRARFESGQRDDALTLLAETDQGLSTLEADWANLRSLLEQVKALREAAEASEQKVIDVEDDAQRLDALLARPLIDGATIQQGTEIASRDLMRLHEALPAVMEEELEVHAQKLDTLKADPEAGRKARALHSEASRHLRRGRISEASLRLKELRATIREMEAAEARAPPKAPAPVAAATVAEASAPAAAVAPAPGTKGDPALARLLQQARGLAARVRTLPPDSEIAFEAAAEIRRATELLRARKLQEAEVTLTRLMRTLDAEHSSEEVVV